MEQEEVTPLTSTDHNVTGWRKSSRSANQTNCVEVGRTADNGAAIRDTKNRDMGHLTATPNQWANFVNAIKTNRLPA